MTFSPAINVLPTIDDYESADAWFNKKAQPSTRSGVWRSNQRPLKDARAYHYRLEQHRDGEFYDVCLYHTVMARFYKPTPEGRRVMYTSHSSNTSKLFMRNVTRHSHLLTKTTTDREVVAVPIPSYNTIHDTLHSFSASLWLDTQGRVDVAKSAHTPMYKRKVGESDKETRAHIRELCDPYITLACLRINDFRLTEHINLVKLEPFTGGVQTNYTTREALQRMTQGKRLDQNRINDFMGLAENVYDYEASRLHYKAKDGSDSDKDVTESILADGLWRVIVRETAALRKRSVAIELPQFMNVDKFPRTTATPYA